MASWLTKKTQAASSNGHAPVPETVDDTLSLRLLDIARDIPGATSSPLNTINDLGLFEVLAELPQPYDLIALADEIDAVTKALLRYSTQVLGSRNSQPRTAATWLDTTLLSPPGWLHRLRHDLFEANILLITPTRPDTLRRVATLIERLHNQTRAAATADYRSWPTIVTTLKITLSELSRITRSQR